MAKGFEIVKSGGSVDAVKKTKDAQVKLEMKALRNIHASLEPLDGDARTRVLRCIMTMMGIYVSND